MLCRRHSLPVTSGRHGYARATCLPFEWRCCWCSKRVTDIVATTQASGNNFYYALLLLMLFICCLPVAYTCVWLKPSWHCGPFRCCVSSSRSSPLTPVSLSFSLSLSSQYERVYHILTNYVESLLPPSLNKVVDFLVRGREEFARRLC